MIAPNNFTVKGLIIKVNSNAKACAGSYKLVVDGVESNSLTLGAGQTGVLSNSFEEAVTEGQEVTTRLLTGNCSGTIKAYYSAVVDWDQGV